MITAEDIERAERILQITYSYDSMPRQLEASQVDLAAFNNWLSRRRQVVENEYRLAYRAADPRLHAAYATLLMHMFLVGLVVGRGERTEIT